MAKHEFRMPTLDAVSVEYAALVTKRTELDHLEAKLIRERKLLRIELADMAEAKVPAVSAGVAKLLGDPVVASSKDKAARVREIDRELGDITAARDILRKQMDGARVRASRAVADRVMPEYRSRVARVVESLAALTEAIKPLQAFRTEAEVHDIALGAFPSVDLDWLGSPTDGHLARTLREAKWIANGR